MQLLSLSYCPLLHRELFVDGNQLEAEGAIALLTQLAEAATQEGFERERLKQEKIDALEAEKLGKWFIFFTKDAKFYKI